MEYERFEALVHRLERDAEDHPTRYRARVLGLSLLGYGYVFTVLAVVLALGAGVVLMIATGHGRAAFFKFGWIIAIFVWSVGQALWVRLDAPEGPVIRREDAPLLFERIEAIRKRLRAPRPHVVLAQPDVNAAIAQVPRLGIFGWQKNYLLLGLPLMRACSTPEFEGVIAHEFGHLAGSHGRFGNWIYRQRSFWSRILPKLEEKQSFGASLFRRFLEWFTPYFQAYTFVLGRRQEYEADSAGAEGHGARIMADALARVNIAAHRVHQDFWPEVNASVRRTAEVPARLFVDLGGRLQGQGATGDHGAASEEEIVAWAMQVETTLDDTHPALKDRLAALGEDARVPPPPERSAAQELLGDCAERLEARFSEEWREQVAPRWSEGFEAAEKTRERIRELEAQGERSSAETWELACLLSEELRMEDAFVYVRAVVEREPDFAKARRTWGIHLLEKGDETGLAHLERALELEDDGTLDACRAAYGFLSEAGRTDEAEAWAKRAGEYQARIQRAEAERASFQWTDAVEPHGLPDGNLDPLREQLAARKPVKQAWIVRKKVRLYPEQPAFVLLLELSGGWYRTQRQRHKLLALYSQELQVSNDWFCLLTGSTPRKTRKRIQAAAGEPFYLRRA